MILIRMWLVVLAIGLGNGLAFAIEIPEQCDAIPRFEAAPRSYVNDVHRDTMSVLALERGAARASRADAALFRLLELYEATVAKQGEQNGEAAVLRADVGYLALEADEERYRDIVAAEWRAALDTLYRYADSKAEADYLLRLASEYRLRLTTPERKLAIAIRYGEIVGDTLGQFAFLDDIFLDEAEPEILLAIADKMTAIAGQLGHQRAIYTAGARALLMKYEAGQQEAAKAIARDILPVAKARLERAFGADYGAETMIGRRKCWAEDRVLEIANELLKGSLTQAELEENYRFESIEAALYGETETDFLGASYVYAKLIDLRDIGGDAYRDVMEFFAEINNGIVRDRPATAADMAMLGGRIYESLVLPTVAGEFFRDAEVWSRDAPPASRLEILKSIAEFEWSEGRIAALPEKLDEALELVGQLGDEASVGAHIAILLVKAAMEEARLNDAEAAVAFAEAIDIALPQRENWADSKPLELAFSKLTGLIRSYLGGTFCQECGDRVADAVGRYWRAEVGDFSADPGFVDTSFHEFALYMEVFGAARGLKAEQQQAETVLAAVSKRQAGSLLDDVRQVEQTVKSYRLSTAERNRLSVLTGTWMNGYIMDGDLTGSDIVKMLKERNVDKKRKLIEPLTVAMAESASSFGADLSVYEGLGSYSDLLQAMNYPLASRVINEQILWLGDPETDLSFWSAPDARTRSRLVTVFAPAHAKAARAALNEGDLQSASKHADSAMKLMSDRLRSEWQAGNERAGVLYRALRPTLRDVAAVRFDIAEQGGDTIPGAVDQTFNDLQFAMLGDTALAMQAAIRRRITDDPGLRDAIEDRDAARQLIDRIDTLGEISTSKLPWRTRARRDEAADREQKATARIAERLEISEDFTSLRAVALTDVRQTLQPGEALVVIHAGDDSARAMVVPHDASPLLYRVDVSRPELTGRIAELRKDAAGFGSVDIGNASELYSLLLTPAERALGGARKLIVVSDGPLPGLPWPMLVTKPISGTFGSKGGGSSLRGASLLEKSGSGGDKVSWRDLPWLARMYSVSLAPNISTFFAQRAALPESAASKPFLGIGDPVLSGSENGPKGGAGVDSVFVRGTLDVDALYKLPPLPETADELSALARTFGTGENDILLGPQATETDLRKRRLADYKVVAFATHGILAGEIGGNAEPGLVLSRSDSGSDDGYLALSEIMQLGFDAELVILSACNTGGADGRPRAEWMSGLARGFIAGGARQLAVTLWSIPSDPTTRLTTGMARARQQGLDWSQALQTSVLQMIDNPSQPLDAHPGSWSSFVILGVGS